MIIKSYEVNNNSSNFYKYNFYLLYGENIGLKKEIKNTIKKTATQKNERIEILSFYENEILDNEENFYNFVYSGSLFGDKKIAIILEATDKILKIINEIYNKDSNDIFFIINSSILEKKSKLRNFFETNKNTICIPCYLDSEKDLIAIALSEFKKNNIILSREAINLLIEKSNADRDNLRNEIEKIKSYSANKKKIEIDDIKNLINFSGDYKSDYLINECLCGNIYQYKKVLSELYVNTINQILFLRILNSKVQRLLKIKIQEKSSKNLDELINFSKPTIFWKEKPLVKKQLSIWSINELENIINKINSTELLCKKNPQISKVIFFDFFLKICIKASNFS